MTNKEKTDLMTALNGALRMLDAINLDLLPSNADRKALEGAYQSISNVRARVSNTAVPLGEIKL